MPNIKRVTIIVEIIDQPAPGSERTLWSVTESCDHTTGSNPLHHHSDAAVALDVAGRGVIRSVIDRFGDFRTL